jgi:hypothetical protein
MPLKLLGRLALFLGLLGSSHAQSAPAPIHALFLGNSLTEGNDVPGIVQALAQLQGVRFSFDERTPGGWNLEDHWNAGHSELLRTAQFDVLIMQQGPSTLGPNQQNLRNWATVWSEFARTRGTAPALFMVWPTKDQPGGFALVSESYRNAAIAAGAAVFPAGEAWNTAFNARPGLQLYLDDLHALPAGSLLAGMVIGRGLFALDPARVQARLVTRSQTIEVSAAELELFRSIVAAMPATTIDPLPAPAPGTPAAPAPAFPAPTGVTPSPGGGGGSTAPVAALALAALLAARRRGRHA